MRLCAFADESDKTLDGQIAALHRNGIDLIELRNINKKNIAKFTLPEIRELKHRLDLEGIGVWSIGSPIGKIHFDGDLDAELDVFKRLCEHTLELSCRRIRLFSFFGNTDGSPLCLDRVLERMNKYCEVAPSELILCHENEKGIYGDTDTRCLELLTALSRLRAVYDPANFVQCGVDTVTAFDRLLPYIEYIHIKDALYDGRVVVAGKGDGQLHTIIEKYLKNGGDVITCEPHLKKFDGLSSLEHGEKTVIDTHFKTQTEAFDAGVNATKYIIGEILK